MVGTDVFAVVVVSNGVDFFIVFVVVELFGYCFIT